MEIELLIIQSGEALHDHAGVAEQDAIHRQAGSFDWVFVHFNYNKLKTFKFNGFPNFYEFLVSAYTSIIKRGRTNKIYFWHREYITYNRSVQWNFQFLGLNRFLLETIAFGPQYTGRIKVEYAELVGCLYEAIVIWGNWTIRLIRKRKKIYYRLGYLIKAFTTLSEKGVIICKFLKWRLFRSRCATKIDWKIAFTIILLTWQKNEIP